MESWNPGAARNAILDFVERATSPGVGFIEPGDRIATFDNDGTLWVEQPLPVQFNFIFAALIEAVKETPSLATEQPYKAIIEKDHDFFEKVGLQDPDAVSALEGAMAGPGTIPPRTGLKAKPKASSKGPGPSVSDGPAPNWSTSR